MRETAVAGNNASTTTVHDTLKMLSNHRGAVLLLQLHSGGHGLADPLLLFQSVLSMASRAPCTNSKSDGLSRGKNKTAVMFCWHYRWFSQLLQ
jgi:hypothetical protein